MNCTGREDGCACFLYEWTVLTVPPRRCFGPVVAPPFSNGTGHFDLVHHQLQPEYVLITIMSESIDTTHAGYGLIQDIHRPDYMNERVFQRNRLPPRAYFLPPERLSLSGKWKFHYASSPLDSEPNSRDDGAWDLIDVPGKLVQCSSELFWGKGSPTFMTLKERKPQWDIRHRSDREELLFTCSSIITFAVS